MVRRFRPSRVAAGLLLLACGEPGTLGSAPTSAALASAAPGAFEQPAREPPSDDGKAGAAAEVPQRPPLVGTPVGLGGAGPIDDDDPAEADPDGPDAGVPDAGSANRGVDGGARPSPDPGAGKPQEVVRDAGVGTNGPAPATPGASPETNADGGTAPALPSDFTLAIVGSSTAAGDGASTEANTWAAQLEASLGERLEGDVTLHNFASGGFTSAELVPGSGQPGSVDAALAIGPDLILVALAGSNDLSDGTTGAELIRRLTVLRDTALASAVPVFFLSTAPKDLSEPERETLAAWAVDMAQRFGRCPVPDRATPYAPCFVDVFTPLADDTLGLAVAYDSGDGIHINDAGHALIYDRVRDIVEPFVCSRARCRQAAR